MNSDCHCPPATPASAPIGPSLAEVCGSNQLISFLSILHTFLISQCDILDPCRQPPDIVTPDDEYGFIVIGAGAAGSVVASRLSADPRHRVLLIEAGGGEPSDLQVPAFAVPFAGRLNWGYRNEPSGRAFLGQPGQSVAWTRGKMLGGSSSIHGMVYLRGNPADYDEWQRLGNPGWSYADVLPHFERLDRTLFGGHGVEPEPETEAMPLTKDLLAASDAAGLAEVDLNGFYPEGAMRSKRFIQRGTRLSAAKAYLRPHLQRPNLHILQNTMVTKVLLDRLTNRAYAVLARRGNTTDAIEIRATKEVIISAGVEQTPKLLQLSGIGPQSELDRWGIEQRVRLPGVGRNLQNHVAVNVVWETNVLPAVHLNWAVATEYLLRRTGLLAMEGTSLELKYASQFAEDSQSPDVQLEFWDTLHLSGNVCNAIADDRKKGGKFTLFSVAAALKPKSVGHIELRSSDPMDLPRIFGNELSAEHDLEVVLDGVQRIFEIIRNRGLEKYNLTIQRRGSGVEGRECGHFSTEADDYWRCMIRHDTVQLLHPAGTCRMGAAEDEQAVVDHELKVYGVQGLRVVDASVMPKVVAANTCATTMMIGEKAAVMIANTWE